MEKETLFKIGIACLALSLVHATPLIFQKEEELAPEPEILEIPPIISEIPAEIPAEPEEIPEIAKIYVNYLEEQSIFELPLQGSTAFASVDLALADAPNGTKKYTVPQGDGFTILEEIGEYWRVSHQGEEGYVYANYCLLNLPDVIPSAIYENANGQASLFRSSFTDIPNVTGTKFYDSMEYNQRLGHDQYTMAILYQTAKKVAQVQQNAMENGETLIINETYRPYFIQEVVVQNLSNLMSTNSTVRAGVSTAPWNINWFIATGVSTHQTGCAIDTSLGKVLGTEERYAGDFVYTAVTHYQELDMPTPIHELSLHSASETRDISYVEVEVGGSSGGNWEEEPYFAQGEAEPEFPIDPVPEEVPPSEPVPETAPDVVPEATPDVVPNTEPEVQPTPDIVPEPAPVIPEVETLGALMGPITVETLGEIAPSYETQTVYGAWRSTDTMTADARRLESYFKATGMVSIYSEWWHFEDNNNQSNNASRGGYLLLGNFSVEPWIIE